MRIILDTNVLISGIFFSGPPSQILKAWSRGEITLVVSREILDEYYRVSEILAKDFPGVDVDPFLELLTFEAELVVPPSLPHPICEDTADDKFFACALSSGVKFIVSGDKHLLKMRDFGGIAVLTPRQFVDKFLSGE